MRTYAQIAGYAAPHPWHAMVRQNDGAFQRENMGLARDLEESHFGVGPRPISFYGASFRGHGSEWSCPLCCGCLSDFSSYHFGQHYACVRRQRQLSVRWQWCEGELAYGR